MEYRVALLSSEAAESDRTEKLLAGYGKTHPGQYLVKPVSREQLWRAMERAIKEL